MSVSEQKNQQPCITERDAVKRERAAFEAGAICWVGELRSRQDGELRSRQGYSFPLHASVGLDEVKADAAKKFPLPKISRLRELELDGRSYRVINGKFSFKHADGSWDVSAFTAEEVDRKLAMYSKLADLLANPTELVESEEDL